MGISKAEIDHLEALYADRRPFHGELHDHANTGGTSDGQRTLSHWIGALEALKMDFAAILDHKQVRHMYEPEWEDGLFLCGTEPSAHITDSGAAFNHVHYNMLFDSPQPLEELLAEFEEFGFTGGREGHFGYPNFTRQRFGHLIDRVKEKGGLFVHPHPKQLMRAEDPLEYWFRDWTGLEVFYRDYRDLRPGKEYTTRNYALWTDLLAMGKRVWCCAGGDGHGVCSDKALTTLYATERTNAAMIKPLRVGDFTCGAVGIRMCIGDTVCGGECDLANKRLIVCISDFHPSVYIKGHTYRVDILNAEGLVCSQELSYDDCKQPQYLAIDTVASDFYRVELVDVTSHVRIALGNPIWNSRK
jgi:hypothetical protein